jgi:ribosome-binding factor A
VALHRGERLSGEIRKEVADIVANQMRDPRLNAESVSITAVQATADFSSAKIHVSPMTESEGEDILAALEKAKGFIRRQLAQRMQVRAIPELHFILDDSIAYAVRMNEIIEKQIHEDEQAAQNRPEEERDLGNE